MLPPQSKTWRSRLSDTYNEPSENEAECINKIASQLTTYVQCGTISPAQLQKIYKLVASKERLISALAWL